MKLGGILKCTNYHDAKPKPLMGYRTALARDTGSSSSSLTAYERHTHAASSKPNLEEIRSAKWRPCLRAKTGRMIRKSHVACRGFCRLRALEPNIVCFERVIVRLT